jgi:hypothetical protein
MLLFGDPLSRAASEMKLELVREFTIFIIFIGVYES